MAEFEHADHDPGVPVGTGMATLSKRFSNGDTAAFEEVYRDDFAAVCGFLKGKYAARLASDRIEQITIQSFARAAEHHGHFDGAKGTLRPWLCTIADREAARFCRSPQGRGTLLELAVDPDELARMTDPYADDPAWDDELSDLVREALAAIPTGYAEHAQIFWAEACAESEHVGGSISAAEKQAASAAFRQRKHRAKILLRNELLRRGVEKYLRGVTKRRPDGYLLVEGKQCCATENGERRTENGERRTENGERRTENGERRTENG
ncbi:MAG: RNA polymerase sigma factor, partial [Pirellulales bacterium]